MKTKTPLLFATLALLCLAATEPKAQAVSPPPDGGYPGGNTAEGQSALLSRTTGLYNTAVGIFSVLSLTDGNFCTGLGAGTLLVNTADANTATGAGALFSNTTGTPNTANGTFALFSNTTGSFNTAYGGGALQSNTTGHDNTANGDVALFHNTTGNFNTANGSGALFNTTGSNNIALGVSAGNNLTTGDNNIDIGSTGVTAESSTIRIGSEFQGQTRTFIAAIRGVTTGNADTLPVLIDVNGQLGTAPSSRRFKREIQPMDKASEAILALKPVTFHYKSDSKDMPQFGLIAEEVAQVNPDLVVRDKNGEIYTVRYDAVNAMLLNEFLKEHEKVEQQERKIQEQDRKAQAHQGTITELTSGMKALAATVKEQAILIQKVSAQIEAGKSATKVVVNSQ